MSRWQKFTYRDFYDVPRIFVVRYDGRLLLFESLFDEQADDYTTEYDVYLLPDLADQDFKPISYELSLRAVRKLGVIPVREVKFNVVRGNNRVQWREVDVEAIESWGAKQNWR